MRESVIRDYLAGRAGVAALRLEVERAQAGLAAAREDAPAVAFELVRRHLLMLCDAVLAGELPTAALPLIATRMLRSSGFVCPGPHPEGRVVREVLVAWQALDPAAIGRLELTRYRQWVLAGRAPEALGQPA